MADNTDSTNNPGLAAYPQYFDIGGVPARILSRVAVPEVYAGNDRWEGYDDRWELIHSRGLTADEATALAKQYDATNKHPKDTRPK